MSIRDSFQKSDQPQTFEWTIKLLMLYIVIFHWKMVQETVIQTHKHI